MRHNIDSSLGVIFSQRLLLTMIGKGIMRSASNAIISEDVKIARDQQIDFQYLVLQDSRINSVLTRDEIMNIFDMDYFRKNIDFIFDRAGL